MPGIGRHALKEELEAGDQERESLASGHSQILNVQDAATFLVLLHLH